MRRSRTAPGGYRTLFRATDDHGRKALFVLGDERMTEAAQAGDVITDAEVRCMMAEAAPRWSVPADADLTSLIRLLNQIRVTAPQSEAPLGPDDERVERVKKAILTLIADLPLMLTNAEAQRQRALEAGEEPGLSDERHLSVIALLAVAQKAHGSFYWPARRRRQEAWHDVAEAIAFSAANVWRANGAGEGTKPDSPIVRLLALMLPRVGEGERSEEAIARALARMSSKRKKPGPRVRFTNKTRTQTLARGSDNSEL